MERISAKIAPRQNKQNKALRNGWNLTIFSKIAEQKSTQRAKHIFRLDLDHKMARPVQVGWIVSCFWKFTEDQSTHRLGPEIPGVLENSFHARQVSSSS